MWRISGATVLKMPIYKAIFGWQIFFTLALLLLMSQTQPALLLKQSDFAVGDIALFD